MPNGRNLEDKLNTDSKPESPISIFEPSWLSLAEDEEEVVWTHPSAFMYAKSLIASGVLLIAGLYLATVGLFSEPFFGPEYQSMYWVATISLILIGFGTIIFDALKYYSTFYVVTTEKVIVKTKIINKDPQYTYLNTIQSSSALQENFGLDQLLGYGKIKLSTAGEEGYGKILPFVPAPNQFNSHINTQRKRNRQGRESTQNST